MNETPPIRFIVAYLEENGSWLTSMSGNHPLKNGWYRLIVDDDGRQAFEAGPFQDAREALRA